MCHSIDLTYPQTYMDCTQIVTTMRMCHSIDVKYPHTYPNSPDNVLYAQSCVSTTGSDPDFVQDSLDISSSVTDTPFQADLSPESETKFIVLESLLNALFKFCPQCGSPITQIYKSYSGSNFNVKLCCHQGHNATWQSTKFLQAIC